MKDFIKTYQADFAEIRPLINNQVSVLTDDPTLQDALVQQLGPDNFVFSVFNDVSTFTAHYPKTPPLAIVLDKSNSATGGPDVDIIVKLKQTLQPCPPIICISATNDLDSRLAAARAGCSRFIAKPLNLANLGRTLRGYGTAEQQEPYKVLLIDDDEDLLTLFSKQLQRADITVEACLDARQGLEKLSHFHPDLLLLDVHMPDLSGEELTQVIRQDDNFVQMPIIYLSMDDAPEQQQAIMEQGGDEFLSKRVGAPRLVAHVKEQIKRAREEKRINQGLRVALWNSELRRFALDNHAIVSTTNINGNITYVNDTFCEISGYQRAELLGQNHRLLKSGYHSLEFYTDLWLTISQGEIWQGIICNRCKDGSEYWVESTIVPFLDLHGLPYQYVSVRTDITELRASQDRLHRSQVFANIGTWDWNIQSGELFWSERIGPLFGYDEAVPETTYENFIAAVHPDDRPFVINAITQCVEQGADYNIEHRVVWPDGSAHWVSERGNVVRDKNGKPLHMLGVVQDIDQRKQMELQLLEHKAAMDSSLEGIAIIDVSGQYRYLNPAMAQTYGYSDIESLIGQYWSTHYNADQLLHFEEAIIPSLLDQHTWSGETTAQRKDGSSFPQHLSLSSLDDGSLVCIIQDISINKQVEAELITAKNSAEQASQAKSQFLSSMSHELRTPMNAIIGFSQLLEMDSLNETQSDNVNEILKAGSHLLELINEVLDLSRVEAGRLELSIEDVSLYDVVQECLTLVTALAEQRDIRIVITHNHKEISREQGYQLGAVLRADRTRLKQALINLLSNAVKYNCSHGKLSIDCMAVEENRLRISISDTGLGMTPSQQSQLFQAFNRLGAEYSDTEGTGIGLVYTKKIIELMGGHIGVNSMLGEGSTFWFELNGYYRPKTPECANQPSLSTPPERTQKHNQYTILYVEDNPANMRLMEQMLKHRSDIHLLKAHEPLLGLEHAAKNQPDLIMLDINLPGMNGYDMLQILQHGKQTRSIPVIAISANAMPADIQKGLDAGFDHYITKPINLQQLFKTLDEALKQTESATVAE